MPETDHQITMTAKLVMEWVGLLRETADSLEDAVKENCPGYFSELEDDVPERMDDEERQRVIEVSRAED